MKKAFILFLPSFPAMNSFFKTSFFFISLCLLSACASTIKDTSTQKNLDTGLRSVNTFDIYVDNATIHALFSGKEKQSQELAVNYIYSRDSGKTWSSPISVNNNISPVKKSKRGNDFQIAAYKNKVMAAWQTQGGEPWTGIISTAMSNDNGETWHKISPPVDSKHSKIDQGYFDLTADSQGNFHITWLDDREEAGDTQVLRYAKFDEKNNQWLFHKALEQSACTCCWSRIRSDKSGNIHVLFRDDSPRDMMLISSFDSGKSWQAPQPAWNFDWQFVGCPHQGGGLATTSALGETILHSIVWNGNDSKRGLNYQQSSQKKNTAPIQIGFDKSFSGDIAAINHQHLGIVYTLSDIGNKRVLTKISTNGGKTWSSAHQLSSDKAKPSHPRIVSSPEGFKFFWTEWQDNGNAIVKMSEFY